MNSSFWIPAHAVPGAVDLGDLGELASLEDGADEALIDDGGRASALGHEGLSGQFRHGPVGFTVRMVGGNRVGSGRGGCDRGPPILMTGRRVIQVPSGQNCRIVFE